MHKATCAVRCFGLTVALLVVGTAAHATDFDFSGNFDVDNDVLWVEVTVAVPGNVTLFTSSWVQGGFDPVLSVWGADWGLLEFQDDGFYAGSTLSNDVSFDHGPLDAHLDVLLASGDYTVSLTQANNYPVRPNVSDGFTHDGDPDFTRDWGTQAYFNGGWEPLPDPRNSNWELHILNVASARVVPEPSTWLLLGIGGLVVARLRRRC